MIYFDSRPIYSYFINRKLPRKSVSRFNYMNIPEENSEAIPIPKSGTNFDMNNENQNPTEKPEVQNYSPRKKVRTDHGNISPLLFTPEKTSFLSPQDSSLARKLIYSSSESTRASNSNSSSSHICNSSNTSSSSPKPKKLSSYSGKFIFTDNSTSSGNLPNEEVYGECTSTCVNVDSSEAHTFNDLESSPPSVLFHESTPNLQSATEEQNGNNRKRKRSFPSSDIGGCAKLQLKRIPRSMMLYTVSYELHGFSENRKLLVIIMRG